MRISDWSSDVCSSDLLFHLQRQYRPRRRSLISTDRRREWSWCKSGGPFRFPHSYPASLPVHTIGRAHVFTPVTNAQLVCRLLHEKQEQQIPDLHSNEPQRVMIRITLHSCLHKHEDTRKN